MYNGDGAQSYIQINRNLVNIAAKELVEHIHKKRKELYEDAIKDVMTKPHGFWKKHFPKREEAENILKQIAKDSWHTPLYKIYAWETLDRARNLVKISEIPTPSEMMYLCTEDAKIIRSYI